MANVVGSVLGGTPQRFDSETVGDVRVALDLDDTYQASVQGESVDDSYVLSDEEFVSFAPAVKGG